MNNYLLGPLDTSLCSVSAFFCSLCLMRKYSLKRTALCSGVQVFDFDSKCLFCILFHYVRRCKMFYYACQFY